MPSLPDVMTADAAQLARAAHGTRHDRPAPANHPLFEWLLRIGDTTLILGHRLSEWCGRAPALEEDIAFANIALDLIGQTQMWLGLAGETEGAGRDADALAYRRDAADFRNVLMVERPNGDFGRTLMRQFLFDAWHHALLSELVTSSHEEVAGIAAKALKEASYHLERSADLVVRLGDGTEESHGRMQLALDDLWPYTGEFFLTDTVDAAVAEAGIAPAPDSLRPVWDRTVDEVLDAATLARPEGTFAHKGGRRGIHTEHLGFILAEMQFLQRAYPDASW